MGWAVREWWFMRSGVLGIRSGVMLHFLYVRCFEPECDVTGYSTSILQPRSSHFPSLWIQAIH